MDSKPQNGWQSIKPQMVMALDYFNSRLQPAGIDDFRLLLGKLASAFPLPRLSPEDAELRAAVFAESDVGSLPPDLMALAGKRVINNHQRRQVHPTPGEVLAEIASEIAELRAKWWRAEMAIREAEREAAEQAKRPERPAIVQKS